MNDKNQVEKIYSLSPMQEGMLFYSLIDRTSAAHFQQAAFKIEGELDIGIMQKSLDVIVERYDIFRTIFVHENIQIPKQVVLKNREVKIHYEDIAALSCESRNKHIESYRVNDRAKAFELSRDILLRLAVFKIEENVFQAVWSNHHILMDGWCVGIILREIFEVYSLITQNRPVKLDKIYPYSNYIKWLEKKNKAEAASYWENVIENYTEIAALPVFHNEKQGEYLKQEYIYNFDKELTSMLSKFAASNHVTLYSILQTVWGILLQRYNTTNDVIFGSVISGRPPEVENVDKMVGLFINSVPVRVKCDDSLLCLDLVRELQKHSVMAEKYSYYPLYSIQQKSDLKGSLINHILVYENYPSWNEKNLSGFKLTDFELAEQTNYDFDICIKNNEQIQIKVNFNAKVYCEELMSSLLSNFEAVARGIINNPLEKVNKIDILSKTEKEKTTVLFKGKDVAFEKDKTIFRLIEEQTERSPDKIALCFGIEKYTYRQLNNKANQIAGFLKANGFGKGELAAIMLERSPLMLESILGIWKAGGAYIPIDTAYPSERILTVLKDSEAKILLTRGLYTENADLLKNTEFLTIDFDACETEIAKQAVDNPNIKVNTDALAYVIYTSGSTGKPKGAMVEHIGMHNHINAKINDLNITKDSVIVQNASHCFDISVWQFFSALVSGGTTVIYPSGLCMNADNFVDSIEKDRVTILEVVPSFLYAVLECLQARRKEFKNLEYLVVTGETVKAELVKNWFKLYPSIKLVNAYGPTEASDDITHYIMDRPPEYTSIPIGKPLQNFSIYIVDQWMNLCPVGVKGEICVAGVGVGKGYLNDKEKTKAVFVENPFDTKEARLYKTGDIGRWMPDGNIEFFGRKDYQVKIRGFRIELGEIESRLAAYPAVKEAVVIDRQDKNGSRYLCAYITSDSSPEVQDIKKYLSESLPDYMLPAYILQIESVPLTNNGKVDRKALPEPDIEVGTVEYEAPGNDKEEKLAAVFEEVLDIRNVGINDNFFQLGGDSIKAIQISSRLRRYGMLLDIKHIFDHPRISELSAFVSVSDNCRAEADTMEYTDWEERLGDTELEYIYSMAGKEIEAVYPLSPMQEGMLFHSIYNRDDNLNIHEADFEIYGEVNIDLFEKSLNRVIERHSAFRTIFLHEKLERPQQVVLKKRSVKLAYEDISALNEKGKEEYIQEYISKERASGFRLSEDIPARMSVLKIASGVYRAIWCFHHIIIDGWCFGIIIGDLIEIYQALHEGRAERLEKAASYGRYIKWLEQQDRAEAKAYWSDYLEGYTAGMPLSKFKKGISDKYTPATARFSIGSSVAQKMAGLARENDVTLNTAFQVIWAALLRKYNNSDDVVFGAVISGRPYEVDGMEKIVGLFINTIPVRSKQCKGRTFAELLKTAQEQAIKSEQKGYLPLNEIQSGFRSKEQLLDHIVVYQNYPFKKEIAESELLKLDIEDIQALGQTNYDMNVIVTPGEGLDIEIVYNSSVFELDFINKLDMELNELAVKVTENPLLSIDEIELVSGYSNLYAAGKVIEDEGDFDF